MDDSVDPSLLSAIASRWPRAEFGVLFRPGREGEPRGPARIYAFSSCVSALLSTSSVFGRLRPPSGRASDFLRRRYPSRKWLEALARASKSTSPPMQLAGHLCGSAVDAVLKDGDVRTPRPTSLN